MICTDQGLPRFAFEALQQPGIAHAIYTRLGGVSAPPFDSLNQSLTVADRLSAVHENLARACADFGCQPDAVVNCQQVHGNHVAVVTAADAGSKIAASDAMVTTIAGLTLTMRFADCTPVLLADPVRRAVGIAHAGWRGTVRRVAYQAARAMVERLGCDPADIVAGIGPAIGPCCYQVGPEVVEQFAATFGQGVISRRTPDGHAHVDLWQANARQLRQAGLTRIARSDICTCCERDTWFSHRGDGGRTGRFAGYIRLIEDLS